MLRSHSTLLAPFLILLITACTNDDDTNKKLRTEIELKDRQKHVLQNELRVQNENLQNKTEEYEQLKMVGGPEVVAKAEADRQSAILAKEAAEKALVELEAELKASRSSAENLAAEIKKKTSEITKLTGDLQKVGADAEALRPELQNAKKELVELQNEAKVKEEMLAKENLELKVEINAKLAQIGSLQNRIDELSATAANLSILSDVQVKLETAKKELADLQLAKSKTDLELALSNKTIHNIMSPVFGMYYNEMPMTFDGKVCRQFVYVEASGVSTQAILCDDNRVQWERRLVTEFAAAPETDFASDIGLQMKTELQANSCGANTSLYKSSSSLSFEKYLNLHDTTGSGTLGLMMDGKFTQLVSSSHKLYTEDCEGLLKFAAEDKVLDSSMLPLLKQAAQVCNLVLGQASTASLDAGCFTAPNTFVK